MGRRSIAGGFEYDRWGGLQPGQGTSTIERVCAASVDEVAGLKRPEMFHVLQTLFVDLAKQDCFGRLRPAIITRSSSQRRSA